MTARTARGLAWSLWALAMVLAGAAVVFLVLGWSTPAPEGQFGFRGFAVIFAVSFGTVGALIASRHQSNPIGWIFLAGAIGSGFQELANQYAIWAVLAHDPPLPLGTVAAWFPAWIWLPATSTAMFLLLLFPNGHLPSRRWRIALWIGLAGTAISTFGFAFIPGPTENFHPVRNPFGFGSKETMGAIAAVGQFLYGLGIILSAAALFLRFRRSRGDEREQLKWLASSGAFLSLSFVTSFVGQGLFGSRTGQVTFPVAILVIAGFITLPIATGIAILKYRLYDIDVVINKAVVYGALAAFISAVYVGIVVGLGTLAGSRGSPFLSAVAAAVVALAFQPVRRRAQRLANRLVFGRRATPYEVLSGFSDRLGEAYSVDDVLPRMARVLGEGIGADRVAVWLRATHGFRPAAAWPSIDGLKQTPDIPPGAVEVRHQGELLGALTVEMPASEPLAGASAKLVTDLAGQAGLVLRNVRLIEELRESRRRIVAAQDDRARKLERDIHDGAQQQLVALAVKARLAEQMIERDPTKARELVDQIQIETTDALENLRDLARGIYPPLLADKGLVAALEAQTRKASVPVTVEADGVGRLGQDVEAAVYFCVLEALQNVAKYAQATVAEVRLRESNGSLAFEVVDQGVGFDPGSTTRGTGLQGMADRLAAIGGDLDVRSTPGGGTTVAGRIPWG